MKTLPEEEKEEISQEITLINQKLATDQLSLKNFIKGEFSLQHLLEVSDTLMEKIYQRAVYLQKRNHPMESAALFKFLILLNPFCADYWLGVGFSALNLHELEDAKQYFDTAISIDPKNPKVYYFAAICAKLQQDHDSVSKYCNEGQAVGSVEWDLIFKDLTKPFN
jgi:tetratricopeptide (TPR) repeat protein